MRIVALRWEGGENVLTNQVHPDPIVLCVAFWMFSCVTHCRQIPLLQSTLIKNFALIPSQVPVISCPLNRGKTTAKFCEDISAKV